MRDAEYYGTQRFNCATPTDCLMSLVLLAMPRVARRARLSDEQDSIWPDRPHPGDEIYDTCGSLGATPHSRHARGWKDDLLDGHDSLLEILKDATGEEESPIRGEAHLRSIASFEVWRDREGGGSSSRGMLGNSRGTCLRSWF